jgi:hypothetical protein
MKQTLASRPFDLDKAHIVTMISNPARYESRYELFFPFQEHILQTTPNFWVCELQTGDRPFVVTDASNPRHLQVRSVEELWHKENCLNLIMRKMAIQCPDWKYVGWVDADIQFLRPDWFSEMIHQLQIYHVIQMFETATDLGPTGQAINIHKSFMANYLDKGAPHAGDLPDDEEWYMQHGHPGYAWAATRTAINTMGGLYDRSILGSGDRNMAYALIGRVEQSYNENIAESYKRDLKDYERECLILNMDVGVMEGNILHAYHGPKQLRGYKSRWEILVHNEYDPDRDIKEDAQGLYQLTNRKPRLRDDIRRYFRERDEDSKSLANSNGIKKPNLNY